MTRPSISTACRKIGKWARRVLLPCSLPTVRHHGGHIADSSRAAPNRAAPNRAAAGALLGWWLWLRAWLGEVGVGVEALHVPEPRAADRPLRRADWLVGAVSPPRPGAPLRCDVRGGAMDVTGVRGALWRYSRATWPGLRAINAFCARIGSPRVVFARWRRLFRLFTDFNRNRRGDMRLPGGFAEPVCRGGDPPWETSTQSPRQALPPPGPPAKRGGRRTVLPKTQPKPL